ncbi:MAG: hypothetical protein QXV17_08740 [Candidatus Micrarchaeaceae archaeon]
MNTEERKNEFQDIVNSIIEEGTLSFWDSDAYNKDLGRYYATLTEHRRVSIIDTWKLEYVDKEAIDSDENIYAYTEATVIIPQTNFGIKDQDLTQEEREEIAEVVDVMLSHEIFSYPPGSDEREGLSKVYREYGLETFKDTVYNIADLNRADQTL